MRWAGGRDAVRRLLLLQASSGALVWCASPGLGEQFWLAGVALTPFLLSVHGLRLWPAAAWGLLGGLWCYLPGKWTTFANAIGAMGLSAAPETAAVVAFFVLFGAPFALFSLLWAVARPWQAHAAMPWAAGFVFAGLMVCAPTIFPYTPAVMLTGAPVLIQLAEIGGEALLLALLLTVNFGVAHLIATRCRRWRAGLAAILMPVFVAVGYGQFALSKWSAPAAQTQHVLGLQAQWPRNSSDGLLLRDTARKRPLSAVELTRAGLANNPQCQFVVWPESPRVPTLPDKSCAVAAALSKQYATPILASCHGENALGPSFSARLFAQGGLAGEHLKSRLVPVYESGVFGSAGGLVAGEGASVLRAPNLAPFSPSICYEIHFRHDLRQAARGGAQLFVHMASFTVFRSRHISEWDLAMTRIRAVETRRAIVRSVNAGVAGMVLPSGRWRHDIPAGQSGVTCHAAPLSTYLTVYSRYGDVLFWLLTVVFIGVLMHGGRAR